jgi:isopenicillin-N epimerase
MSLDRRRFLAGAGLGAAAALAGMMTRGARTGDAEPLAPDSRRWDPGDWGSVRAQFRADPEWIHLAGLLLSSHPEPVRAAIEAHRRALDENPAHYLNGEGPRLGRATREAAAAYMAARADDIALTDSTTVGLALVYHGLEPRPGEELLTSTHDHRATHESLEFSARRGGASVRQVRLYQRPRSASVDEIVGNLAAALRPSTRVVALTWVHSSTGVKLPVSGIADVIRDANARRDPAEHIVFCLDGVHGFGVEDADVAALGCDVFIAGTHKWLFGPRGTGLIWARRDAQPRIRPVVPSFTRDGTWGGNMSPGGFKPFEHLWGLAAAFQFHRSIGRVRVAGRIHELNGRLRDGLAGMGHVTLHTPAAAELSSGIVCFEVAGASPARVVSRMHEHGIIASRTPYTPTYARFTAGLLNSDEEIDQALRAVRALA